MECSICKEDKPVSEFYIRARTGNPRADCKKCCYIRSRAWVSKNPEVDMAAKRRHATKPEVKLKNAERQKKTDRTLILQRHYAKNKVKVDSRNRDWARANPEMVRVYKANRKAAELSRTPGWFSEIDEFILVEASSLARQRQHATGFKWEVDHVVPLQGKLVSGLHIGNNLAVVPQVINRSKLNKFTPVDGNRIGPSGFWG